MLKVEGNFGIRTIVLVQLTNLLYFGGLLWIALWCFDWFFKTPWSRG